MKDLKQITKAAIELLVSKGADTATAYACIDELHEFNMDGGEFSLLRTAYNNTLSLIVIKEHRKGTVSINSFEDDDIAAAVSDCIAGAESAEPDEAWGIAPGMGEREFTLGVTDGELDRLFERTRELASDIQARYPAVMIEQMMVSYDKSTSVYRNTNGSVFSRADGAYSVDIMFSAHDGEVSSSFFSTGAVTQSLDVPFIELGSIDRDLRDVSRQIHTSSVGDSFDGIAMFTPSCLESLLSSLIGNFASDGVILDNTSLWRSKLGQRVADESVTISFKPSDGRIVCPQTYTSEGFLAEDFCMIENGVLNGFLLSLYVANKTALERATATGGLIMQSGDVSSDEIISKIERGILVGRFSGGSPGVNGDFSGVAKNSFLIENGKVTKALSETMISGNLATLFNNVFAISSDTVCDGSTVLPYCAFTNVKIFS